MQTREQCALYSVDADGTLYNLYYKIIFSTLAADYGKEFIRLSGLNRPYTSEEVAYLHSSFAKMLAYVSDRATIDACRGMDFDDTDEQIEDRTDFIEALQDINPEIYAKAFCATNVTLITKIVEQCESMSRVFLSIGSLRQTFQADEYNSQLFGTGFISRDIYILAEELEKRLPQAKVAVFPFTILDAVLNQKVGTNLAAILKDDWYEGFCKQERTKISLHYGMIHGLCLQLEDSEIDFELAYHFVDDIQELHDKAYQIYVENPQLLPKSVSVHCELVTDGSVRRLFPNKVPNLIGTGGIDRCFLTSTVKLRNLILEGEPKTSHRGASLIYIRDIIGRFEYARTVKSSALGRTIGLNPVQSDRFDASDNKLKRKLNSP